MANKTITFELNCGDDECKRTANDRCQFMCPGCIFDEQGRVEWYCRLFRGRSGGLTKLVDKEGKIQRCSECIIKCKESARERTKPQTTSKTKSHND